MDKMQMQEMISALADGQLRGEALERVIQTVATDAQARTAWHTYHLIGDVLRSGNLPTGTAPATFLAGFQVRLEREQARERIEEFASAPPAPLVGAVQQVQSSGVAANDASFRWKLVAGIASLAAPRSPAGRRRFGAAVAGWIPAQRHLRGPGPLRAPFTHAASFVRAFPSPVRALARHPLRPGRPGIGGGATAGQRPWWRRWRRGVRPQCR
jgi:hypothetical protein